MQLNWRRVVAVKYGPVHRKHARISNMGGPRYRFGVGVFDNDTLHDNGLPYLIVGEGIGIREMLRPRLGASGSFSW